MHLVRLKPEWDPNRLWTLPSFKEMVGKVYQVEETRGAPGITDYRIAEHWFQDHCLESAGAPRGGDRVRSNKHIGMPSTLANQILTIRKIHRDGSLSKYYFEEYAAPSKDWPDGEWLDIQEFELIPENEMKQVTDSAVLKTQIRKLHQEKENLVALRKQDIANLNTQSDEIRALQLGSQALQVQYQDLKVQFAEAETTKEELRTCLVAMEESRNEQMERTSRSWYSRVRDYIKNDWRQVPLSYIPYKQWPEEFFFYIVLAGCVCFLPGVAGGVYHNMVYDTYVNAAEKIIVPAPADPNKISEKAWIAARKKSKWY